MADVKDLKPAFLAKLFQIIFLNMSSSEARASWNHFFFCLRTFMNCGVV